ncbi:MAG: hypothetical protein WBP29_14155 [Candidatus Zixiibacteriota bacterium]
MEKSPDQIIARMYNGVLVIIILLLIGAGLASFFKAEFRGFDVASMLVRFYLLSIPGAIIAFTITMFLSRNMNLAIVGMVLSLLWLVFKWMG